MKQTASLTADIRPDRVSVFGYAHVPWMKKHQRMIDTAALPGVEERLAQADMAERVLLLRGYRAVGLDHFALPGDPLFQAAGEGELRRNFQGYTTDQAEVLLGLGVSSIGTLPQGYAQNEKDLIAYAKALRAGRLLHLDRRQLPLSGAFRHQDVAPSAARVDGLAAQRVGLPPGRTRLLCCSSEFGFPHLPDRPAAVGDRLVVAA